MESTREYILHNGAIPSGSGNSGCIVGDDRRILHGKRIPSGSGNSGCVVGDDGRILHDRRPSGSGNSDVLHGRIGEYLRVRVCVVGDDRRVDITSRNYNCRVYRLGFFRAAVHGSIIGMRGGNVR